MSYALFRPSFGAVAANATLSGDQLALQALSSIDTNPLIRGQLSPLGDLMFQSTKLAIELASGKKLSDISFSEAIQLASSILSNARPILDGILSSIAAEAAAMGIGAAAEIIPFMGSTISSIISMASAQAAAEKEQHIQACVQFYHPILPGTGPGLQVLPADIFGLNAKAQADASTWQNQKKYPPTPDVARMFFYSSEDIPVGATFGDGHKYWPSYADPGYVKELTEYKKGLQGAFFGKVVDPFEGAKGIPLSTRKSLQDLRSSMTFSRGSGNDGGRSVFPIYLDLFLSQINQKNLTKKYLWEWIYKTELMKDTDCWKYETRPWNEFWNMIRGWDLTVNPLYNVDKAKLAELLQSYNNKLNISKLSAVSRPSVVNALLAMRKPTTTISQTAAKTIGKIRSLPLSSTTKKKMSPITAVAVGGAVAGAGIYLYARYGRRR